MTKRGRLLWVFMALVVVAASAGCRHKPAYSDIDANRSSRNANQNREVQPGTTPSAGSELPGGAAGEAATSPPQVQSFKTPSFLDPGKSNIKDLPTYPRSRITGLQIGPSQGVNMISLVLQTLDQMDKIAAYYDGVIKNNQWSVVSRTIDPEQSEWVLNKGEENSAKIQVKKDPRTGRLNIFILRGEKLDEPKKEPPSGL
jgi:hypothetical protein